MTLDYSQEFEAYIQTVSAQKRNTVVLINNRSFIANQETLNQSGDWVVVSSAVFSKF